MATIADGVKIGIGMFIALPILILLLLLVLIFLGGSSGLSIIFVIGFLLIGFILYKRDKKRKIKGGLNSRGV